ncbi:MAG: HlyD family type I secretion periplasmic adaptor subunit [Burkholderiales bacterium]|nr:HlyD family type I secretion periplasmic adaptor subunit [Burkholderiales bacterium]
MADRHRLQRGVIGRTGPVRPAPRDPSGHADFLPALQALETTPPHPLPRLVLLLLVLFLAAGLTWAALAKIDIVASAEGRLVPASQVKIVQPPEQGIVKDILVREGEAVRAGQTLMRMDALAAEADRRVIEVEVRQRTLALRRIGAELDGRALARDKGDPPDLFDKVRAQYAANRAALDNAIKQERASLDRARHDRAASAEVRKKILESLPFYRQQDESFQKLARDGFAGAIQAQDKRRERLEKEQDLQTQEFAILAAESAMRQSESRIAQLTADYRRNLHTEQTQETGALEKAQQELRKLAHRGALMELKAPQDGRVKDLATHTPGTVVAPGTILMTLVPVGDRLHAEVYVTNQDVGFVRSGQETRLKLAAYPFQKYGMLEGRVRHVSADARESDPPASPGGAAAANAAANTARRSQALAYKTVVDLGSQELPTVADRLALAPGMAITAEIKLGTRTVLEYLLSPVRGAFHEAARER